MCGIAGFNLSSLDDHTVKGYIEGFLESLESRGPDDRGYEIVDHYALVHRRLSIRGGGEASQPIRTLDGRYCMVYNGELYNLSYLIDELEENGVKIEFASSDTYILMLWVSKFGISRMDELEGTFALAIYDNRTKSLYLTRDRLGIKPLFYIEDCSVTNGVFGFSSELGSLVSTLKSKINLNNQFLSEYMWFGSGCGNETIYTGIKSVPPGSTVVINKNEVSITKWFDLKKYYLNAKKNKLDLPDALNKSINRQTVSDVPVGIFLSGGIDSSLIAALVKNNKKNIKTFTANFDEHNIDEYKIASNTAKITNLAHEVFDVKVEEVEKLLRKLIKAYGEPFGDPAGIPLLSMCTALSERGVKVVLQGDGGDELFCGYRRYQFLNTKFFWIARFIPKFLLELIPVPVLKAKIMRVIQLSKEQFPLMSALLLTEETKDKSPFKLFSKEMEQKICSSTDPFKIYKEKAAELSDIPSLVDRQILIDLQIQMPTQFLPKVDRASMLAGVEARVPLLDEIVLFSSFSTKTKDKAGVLNGKRILRRLLNHLLPNNIIGSQKIGFSTPYATWLADDLYELSRNFVFQDDFISFFSLSKERLNSLFNYNRDTSDDRMYMRWKIFVLSLWFDEYIRVPK